MRVIDSSFWREHRVKTIALDWQTQRRHVYAQLMALTGDRIELIACACATHFQHLDRLRQAITRTKHDKTRLGLMLSDIETVQNAAMCLAQERGRNQVQLFEPTSNAINWIGRCVAGTGPGGQIGEQLWKIRTSLKRLNRPL